MVLVTAGHRGIKSDWRSTDSMGGPIAVAKEPEAETHPDPLYAHETRLK